MDRRPLTTRSAGWARAFALFLAARRVRPNSISVAGVLVALLAAAFFVLAHNAATGPRIILLIAAAVCIQLRLLCNMLDGLVAVEGGLKSKTGDIFNDLPDRIADVAIILGAGAFIGPPLGWTLGWTASIMAVFLAYIRLLGGALGFPQDFRGPMAKPHRMAALTLGCLLALPAIPMGRDRFVMSVALAVIIAGSIVTAWRRTTRIADQLRAR